MENNSTTSTTDPVTLIERLDADEIREQLNELDKRRSALIVLLRVAIRRDRAPKAVTHGDR
jgi:hypothetical protein